MPYPESKTFYSLTTKTDSMKPSERIFGITGGIGCGKSTIMKLLKQMPGIVTCDADQIAKDIILSGAYDNTISPLLEAVLLPSGSARLKQIADIIFTSPEKMKVFQKFIHPLVWQEIIRVRNTSDNESILIVESAIIYESNWSNLFYRVIVVTCRPEEQRQRLLQNRNMQVADIEARIALQLPLAEKVSRADFVIDTTGSENGLEKSVANLFQYLTNRQL